MNPYELMLALRNNKILFQYLEYSAVIFDDKKGWTIHGESQEGELYIYPTTANVLRIVFPIPVPPEIPPEAMAKIVISAQERIEGILGVTKQSLEYYTHVSLDDEEGMDAALIRFCHERKDIKDGLKEISASIKEMMEGMNSMMSMMKTGGAAPKGEEVPQTNSEDIWSTMADIEKNLDEKSEGEDEEGPDLEDFE